MAEPAASAPDDMDVASFRRVILGFRDALAAHRESINDLNVYPVPDGDTGTNMSLTLQSVAEEMDMAGDDPESVCRAVSHGALMGGRGNSGVILSQILRGLTEVVRDRFPIQGPVMAEALAAASDGAYGAVGNPVEGTILTVAREAAEAATAAAAGGAGLVGVLEAASERGRDALARTPQMLQVLADAGVVDAGGAGLLLLLDAALAELDGRPVPEPPPRDPARALAAEAAPGPAGAGAEASTGGSIADLRYEVMFFLDAPDEAVPAFKEAWADLGDSIAVVGGDGLWNCHVHTDDIGGAIEAGIAVGRPHRIRVTDLLEEVEEQEWVRREMGGPPEPGPPESAAASADVPGHQTPEEPEEEVACAAVAVGAGAGVEAILTNLGAHRVVAGGQSMNPSTAELLAAVESVPAAEVVVLPNNKNIIPVAEQLDAATDRTVVVVPTRSIIEGMAALMGFSRSYDVALNQRLMIAASTGVVGGEVTRAVRAATSPAGDIAAGDWLGIGPDAILAVASTAEGAAMALLEALIAPEHDLLTVIVGSGANPAATDAIVEWLAAEHPGLDVDVQEGGQPLYPYYFGLDE